MLLLLAGAVGSSLIRDVVFSLDTHVSRVVFYTYVFPRAFLSPPKSWARRCYCIVLFDNCFIFLLVK